MIALIAVGKITKPQGIRGEVKVMPMTDDPSRFCVLKSVTVDNRAYRISSARVSGGDVFLKLDGVNDRNAAEALRGKLLSIDRALAKPLSDGEFFIADLIGAKIAPRGGEAIGTVREINSFGAADVFSVECVSGKTMSFAFTKAICAEYSDCENILYVDGKALDEVAVYDDD